MIKDYLKKKKKIAVVGLGYVGLPLANAFGKKFSVIGFDTKEERVNALRKGNDITGEVSKKDLKLSGVEFTTDPAKLSGASIIIVAVPTPIDEYKIPDLTPLKYSSETVGKNMQKGATVVYESTVYPGVTEEYCVPILEKHSGLKWGSGFKVGYSPERINPGDKEHGVIDIIKVVSGDDKKTADLLTKLYGSIIRAGIHTAATIKTAEAAKVIENIQRDLNIALINELSIIFNKMGLDTNAVLDAAGTKWNFLPFKPGLVGGHCIGVDPYYLTFKAQAIGYHPQVILSGRRINDNMGRYVAENTVKELIKSGKPVKNSKVLILGFTFKEDVGDIRNTRVIDIYNVLNEYGVKPFIYDPVADMEEVQEEYNIPMLQKVDGQNPYDAIVIAVKHGIFKKFSLKKLEKLCRKNPALIDIKALFTREQAEKSAFAYWRL